MGRGRTAADPGPRRADAVFAIAACAVLAAYNNVAGMRPWHGRRYTVLNVCATGAAVSAAAASGLTATGMGLGRGGLVPGLGLGSRVRARPGPGGVGGSPARRGRARF